MRYVQEIALAPIGYVRHSHPMQKAFGANSYTPEGRILVHKSLCGVNMEILHHLMRTPVVNESIEYNDNRLSLYAAQRGKCAITGIQMDVDDVFCIRKIPSQKGGTDKYANLMLVCKKVVDVLSTEDTDVFDRKLGELNLDGNRLEKLKNLRSLAHVESC